MQLPHMDLTRTRKLMKQRGIDVLLASSPENAFYASGYKPFLTVFGPVIVIVPVDPGLAPTMILSGYLEEPAKSLSYIEDIRSYRPWMPIVPVNDLLAGTVKIPPKPPKHLAVQTAVNILSDCLVEKGLQDSVIASENNLLADSDAHSLLIKCLPKVNFVEAENIFFELRKIKTEDEIRALQLAGDLTVKGFKAIIEGAVSGATIGELQLRYKRGVMEAADADNAMWLEDVRAGITAGDYFKSLQSQEYRVSEGDIIWSDGGLVVYGYTSDMARTFSVGKPGTLQKKIFTTLKSGYEEALSLIKPGVQLKEVYKTIHHAMHMGGFDWYARGHCGHSVGIGPGKGEQPPMITAVEESVFEPNMVIAVECGCYVSGHFGGFSIEEMLRITPDGYEVMTGELSRDMLEI
ncbi:M24 family metallopeptidase [Chloroflexota bacterium]